MKRQEERFLGYAALMEFLHYFLSGSPDHIIWLCPSAALIRHFAGCTMIIITDAEGGITLMATCRFCDWYKAVPHGIRRYFKTGL